jgi:5-hydroxyisourate hydrolase-like protein (transthyretin family)
MSSPHVAGVVALVAAFFPDKDAAFIRRQVTASADALTGLNIAGGRANAHNALKELGPPPPPPPSPTLNVRVSTNKSTYRFGELIIISVTVTSSSDGTPVSAANVALEIKTPSGGTFVGSGRTNSQGRYTTLGVASRSDGAGTYTVTATASKTGFNNGTGSATFTVR